MRKSIATVSLSGTLEEKLSAAALVGFDGVELFENDLISCALSPAQIRQRAADLGLRIELYQPFRDFEGVPADVLAHNLRRADSKFQVMTELGVDLLLVCSNVSPTTVDNDELAAEQLGQLADRAAGHGLRVAYEALAWGRRVADYRHAWRIVAAGDRPISGCAWTVFTSCPGAAIPRASPTSRPGRFSSCSSPTRRTCNWTFYNGADTFAAFPVRAASTS